MTDEIVLYHAAPASRRIEIMNCGTTLRPCPFNTMFSPKGNITYLGKSSEAVVAYADKAYKLRISDARAWSVFKIEYTPENGGAGEYDSLIRSLTVDYDWQIPDMFYVTTDIPHWHIDYHGVYKIIDPERRIKKISDTHGSPTVSDVSTFRSDTPLQLEVDVNRGVVYLHSLIVGMTVFRICRIPDDLLQIFWLGDASIVLDLVRSPIRRKGTSVRRRDIVVEPVYLVLPISTEANNEFSIVSLHVGVVQSLFIFRSVPADIIESLRAENFTDITLGRTGRKGQLKE